MGSEMCIRDSFICFFIRYTCEQGDNLPRYGWLQHDGVSYGAQEIVDEDFILTTEFIKNHVAARGGDWTARIKGKSRFDEVYFNLREYYIGIPLLSAVKFSLSNETLEPSLVLLFIMYHLFTVATQ